MLVDLTTVALVDDGTANHMAVESGVGVSESARVAADGDVGAMDLPSAKRAFERLTDRERTVVRYVGQGYSAPEIGVRLGISPKTVDTYKQRIQEKLNFTHRTQYVQFAMKLGLLAEE